MVAGAATQVPYAWSNIRTVSYRVVLIPLKIKQVLKTSASDLYSSKSKRNVLLVLLEDNVCLDIPLTVTRM